MKAVDTSRSMIPTSLFRGVLRLAAILVAALLWLPFSTVLILAASLFGTRSRYGMIMALTGPFCRTMAALMGLRIRIEGGRAPGLLIFVANHVSWVDILPVGISVSGMFVSRHDVKDWPLIGLFARLAGTVFIDRSSLRSAVESSRAIVERSREGVRVAFFPEGGASGGDDVRPFKPFLFGGIVEQGCAVQPITISYTHLGNVPVTPENRDLVYWYRTDQNFLTQAWIILQLRSLRVTVSFREPLAPPINAERDELRAYVEELRQRTAEGVPTWEK